MLQPVNIVLKVSIKLKHYYHVVLNQLAECQTGKKNMVYWGSMNRIEDYLS